MKIITRRRLLYLVVLVTVLLPLFLVRIPNLDLNDEFDRIEAIKFVASAAGLMGVVLLWWQPVLGWRAVMAKLVSDLISVNDLHKWLGKNGMMLVFLHPALMIIGYGESRSLLLKLGIDNQFDVFVWAGKLAVTVVGYIWLSSAIFRGRIPYRIWKFTHYIGYLVFPLAAYHGFNAGTQIALNSTLQSYIGALIVTWALIWGLRILWQFGLGKQRYELVSKKAITYDVTEYTFKPLRRGIRGVKPGQFVYLQAGKIFIAENHPFTCARFDAATNQVTLCVKSSGPFSSGMNQLEIGGRVWIDGPYGVFTREAYTTLRDIALLAGGIGITPFLQLIDRIPPARLNLIYGNKTKEDIAFYPELSQKLKARMVNVLSRCEVTDPAVLNCEVGFISAELLQKYLGGNITQYEYFVCGPPPMMKASIALLKELGVPEEQVHIEVFSI